MAKISVSRLIHGRLVAQWTILGTAVAGFVVGWLVLRPAEGQVLRSAALPVFISLSGGALAGATLALLYRRASQRRFWVVILVLSIVSAIDVAVLRDVRETGTVLIYDGLGMTIALSLWSLLARGLYVWRQNWR